jgi:large-conductance mechanosensitive channel
MNLSAEQRSYETQCRFLGSTQIVITNFPSEGLWVNHIAVIVFNCIMIIPTILLNAVPMITIWKSSQLNRKPCYFIILVQSVIDLAVGVVSIPLSIVYLWSRIQPNLCSVGFFVLMFALLPVGWSGSTLLALTLERYIAIVYPYSYSTEVTKKKILMFIGCCFAAESSVFIFFLWSERLFQIYAVLKYILLFLCIAFAYMRIYLVVRKLSRSQLKPQDSSPNESLTKLKLFLSEIKQAKACFIVVVCFFALSVLPIAIGIPVSHNLNKFEDLAMRGWALTLNLSNSSANSMIFFWTKTMLKKEAIKVWKSIKSW